MKRGKKKTRKKQKKKRKKMLKKENMGKKKSIFFSVMKCPFPFATEMPEEKIAIYNKTGSIVSRNIFVYKYK